MSQVWFELCLAGICRLVECVACALTGRLCRPLGLQQGTAALAHDVTSIGFEPPCLESGLLFPTNVMGVDSQSIGQGRGVACADSTQLAGRVEDDVAQAVAAAATSATASAALGGKLESWGVLDIPGPGNPVCAYSARCAPGSQPLW